MEAKDGHSGVASTTAVTESYLKYYSQSQVRLYQKTMYIIVFPQLVQPRRRKQVALKVNEVRAVEQKVKGKIAHPELAWGYAGKLA